MKDGLGLEYKKKQMYHSQHLSGKLSFVFSFSVFLKECGQFSVNNKRREFKKPLQKKEIKLSRTLPFFLIC
jgi:hypothetical protein